MSSPPETALLLMDYSPPWITVHLQPLKHPLMQYMCLLFSSIYHRYYSYTPWCCKTTSTVTGTSS